MSTPNFESLRKALPPMIARHDIERYLGGVISRGYLQNLDSEGKGPKKCRIGKKVGYMRDDLISWLEARSS